jgi:hypothetical protein
VSGARCVVIPWPLLEIHAEMETKIVILGIERLQQLQPVSFRAKKLDFKERFFEK